MTWDGGLFIVILPALSLSYSLFSLTGSMPWTVTEWSQPSSAFSVRSKRRRVSFHFTLSLCVLQSAQVVTYCWDLCFCSSFLGTNVLFHWPPIAPFWLYPLEQIVHCCIVQDYSNDALVFVLFHLSNYRNLAQSDRCVWTSHRPAETNLSRAVPLKPEADSRTCSRTLWQLFTRWVHILIYQISFSIETWCGRMEKYTLFWHYNFARQWSTLTSHYINRLLQLVEFYSSVCYIKAGKKRDYYFKLSCPNY